MPYVKKKTNKKKRKEPDCALYISNKQRWREGRSFGIKNLHLIPGGHSREFWVELCRRGLQTLTLSKTKIAHFATLFKTGDTTF